MRAGSAYTLTIPSTNGYAPNSDILAVNDSANGNWTYTYDDFNRLFTANASGQAYTYDYDRYGNRWHQNGPHSSQLAFDANNRITGVTGVTYDSAGNTLGDGTTTYTYDAEGRISSSNNSANGLWCSTYNAEGQRVRKTNVTQGTCASPAQSSSWNFAYDLSNHEIAMVSASGVWDRGEVYADSRRLATYNNSTTYFIHTDWLGTDRVRRTVSGTVYQACSNLPFGDNYSCPGSDASPMHFTGKSHIYESNLDYFGARYYASTIGRFMSPDWSSTATPIPYADLDNPQSLNLYGYVRNNPTTAIDADGHCVEPASCTLEGAALGAELGSSLGPIGTVVGALVGGGVAAYLGYTAADAIISSGKSTRKLRKEWEEAHGKPWPTDPANGKPMDADHDVAKADKGADDGGTNVTPRPHDEHIRRHKDNGDFRRWAKRRWTDPRPNPVKPDPPVAPEPPSIPEPQPTAPQPQTPEPQPPQPPKSSS